MYTLEAVRRLVNKVGVELAISYLLKLPDVAKVELEKNKVFDNGCLNLSLVRSLA